MSFDVEKANVSFAILEAQEKGDALLEARCRLGAKLCRVCGADLTKDLLKYGRLTCSDKCHIKFVGNRDT